MLYGFDIGGSKIELAIFDDNMNGVTSWRIATPKGSYQEFLAKIKEMVEEADQKSGEKGSVGIGLPGFIDDLGRTISANIPCINGQPFTKDMSRELDRPVGFENDVKVFILSEARGGAANGVRYALGLVLGTGVAGGLCIDGELYHGKQNFAGEYGHIPLPATIQQQYNLPLRKCGCGAVGCVEQYLSGPGLLWICRHFGGSYRDVPDFVRSIQSNDKKALSIFQIYIDCISSHLAILTSMFDPDVIVLGGGLSNVKELYQQIAVSINKFLIAGVEAPQVVAPKFGDSSGVRGAAILGQQAAENQ